MEEKLEIWRERTGGKIPIANYSLILSLLYFRILFRDTYRVVTIPPGYFSQRLWTKRFEESSRVSWID
ncbi:unnamed protein product [Clonostachys rosea f. rosea IK726]|uniref:Uncharacterized protein n=2 Tax=Bionectria ochroleuca TaxID=29856 RepID=A0A0B7K1Y8_BIOOC|nr:unnamed protein product [Clonostachys rosea f. rosea IK726]